MFTKLRTAFFVKNLFPFLIATSLAIHGIIIFLTPQGYQFLSFKSLRDSFIREPSEYAVMLELEDTDMQIEDTSLDTKQDQNEDKLKKKNIKYLPILLITQKTKSQVLKAIRSVKRVLWQRTIFLTVTNRSITNPMPKGAPKLRSWAKEGIPYRAMISNRRKNRKPRHRRLSLRIVLMIEILRHYLRTFPRG